MSFLILFSHIHHKLQHKLSFGPAPSLSQFYAIGERGVESEGEGAVGIKASLSFTRIIWNLVTRKLNNFLQPEGSAIFHPDLFCYLQKTA